MDIFNIYFETITLLVIKINWLTAVILMLMAWLISKFSRHIILHTRKISMEINEINLGLGDSSIVLKYDEGDREIAYKLWVELSTRKIGIEYDEENDVIIEVYDSWYEYFKVARELIKSIPITKINDEQELVELSMNILNRGLRPHLTKWQAKYRKWYEEASKVDKNKTPQEIQKEYPYYNMLISDIKDANNMMIQYKNILYKIAFNK